MRLVLNLSPGYAAIFAAWNYISILFLICCKTQHKRRLVQAFIGIGSFATDFRISKRALLILFEVFIKPNRLQFDTVMLNTVDSNVLRIALSPL